MLLGRATFPLYPSVLHRREIAQLYGLAGTKKCLCNADGRLWLDIKVCYVLGECNGTRGGMRMGGGGGGGGPEGIWAVDRQHGTRRREASNHVQKALPQVRAGFIH